jgi:putative nicotinate phosphoribosyltransferase
MSTALLTDMYELTMLQAALADGTAKRRSVFEIFGRSMPPSRRFGVVAGTGRFLEALENFHFEPEQLRFLSDQGIVDKATINYLENFHFDGNIYGYGEGECYFPGSPLLTVESDFAQACIIETMALSIFNHDCAVASAASRMTIAAHGRPCMDFGARRTHEDAGVSAARAAVVSGFTSTSDLEAGMRYGIRCVGTSAHAFTLLHDDERTAFDSQIASLGVGTTILVDTYDIARGVQRAVDAAKAAGGTLGAVRLDSGDLVAEAFKVRAQLDSLGCPDTKIVVTSDLDEYAIAALGAAPVDIYGVGTKLVTGSGVPTAALVYKMVERENSAGEMEKVAKKSSGGKSSVGGRKTAGRVIIDGSATEELLISSIDPEAAEAELERNQARPLQVQLVEKGHILPEHYDDGALTRAAERHRAARAQLPYQAWRLSEGEIAIPTRRVDLDSRETKQG